MRRRDEVRRAEQQFSLAGSSTKTSNAAPPSLPASRAARTAASSASPPRAQLIRYAPLRIFSMALASMMLRVLSVSGVCRVMKSDRLSRPSSSTFSTPSATALSGVRKGSKAITFIFRPIARSATIEPILPQPINPRVLPVSSRPMKRDFSHLPAWVEASAAGIWRATAIIIEMACSAVVIALRRACS